MSSSGDGTIILWDIEKQQDNVIFGKNWKNDVMTLSVNPHNPMVFVSGSIDTFVRLWDIRVGDECQASFGGHESDINHVTWFPDGKSCISGSDDGTCRLFDIDSFCQLGKYDLQDLDIKDCIINQVDVSKSGRFLFVGMDQDPFCLMLDVITKQIVKRLTHPATVMCVRVAPNGTSLATGAWDRFARIWA